MGRLGGHIMRLVVDKELAGMDTPEMIKNRDYLQICILFLKPVARSFDI
jgi:hypothetical protein